LETLLDGVAVARIEVPKRFSSFARCSFPRRAPSRRPKERNFTAADLGSGKNPSTSVASVGAVPWSRWEHGLGAADVDAERLELLPQPTRRPPSRGLAQLGRYRRASSGRRARGRCRGAIAVPASASLGFASSRPLLLPLVCGHQRVHETTTPTTRQPRSWGREAAIVDPRRRTAAECSRCLNKSAQVVSALKEGRQLSLIHGDAVVVVGYSCYLRVLLFPPPTTRWLAWVDYGELSQILIVWK
jgi:hypothetical protein